MSSLQDAVPDLSTPEDGEGDVCRVCRAEGDESMPLIYPCKCSGSVRFVHPDCLKSWLAHSQKRYCEICGHRYAFTKVYPEDVPSTVPTSVYLRQIAISAYNGICLIARVIAVITSWLIWLPTLEMLILNGSTYFVDLISAPSVDGGESLLNGTLHIPNTPVNDTLNDTISALNGTEIVEDRAYFVIRVIRFMGIHLAGEQSFPAFVFRGQLLSIAMAAFLLALILLREWFMQHNWAEHLNPKPKTQPEVINPDDWVVACGISFEKTEEAEAKRFVDDLLQNGGEEGKAMRRGVRAQRRGLGRRERERDGGRKEVMALMAQEIEKRRHEGSDHATTEGRGERLSQGPSSRPQGLHRVIEPETDGASFVEMIPKTQSTEDSTKYFDDISRVTAIKLKRIQDEEMADSRAHELSMEIPSFNADGSPSTMAGSSTSPSLSSPTSGLPRPADVTRTSGLAYRAPEMLSEKAKGKQRAEDLDQNTGEKAETSFSENETVSDGNQSLKSMRIEEGEEEDGWEDMEEGAEDIITFPPGDRTGAPSDDTEHAEHEMGGLPPIPLGHVPLPLPGPPLGPPRTPRPGDPTTAELLTAILNDHGIQADIIPGGRDEDRPPLPQPAIAFPLPVLPAPGVEEGFQIDFVNDDEDAAWDREDWDGILEVIGLIGPVSNLFQNVIFAAVIIAAAQTVFVGIPMIVGKLFLCTDIFGVGLWITRNVLRAIRLVTDPLVDLTLEITRDVVLAPALSSVKGLESVVAKKIGLTPPSTSTSTFSIASLFSVNPVSNSTLSGMFSRLSGGGQNGHSPRDILTGLVSSLTSTSGRLLCMATGYGVVANFTIFALGASEFGYIDFNLGVVRGEIKQYVLFGKLALFMLVELLLFPMGIGFILGCCVFPTVHAGSLSVLWELFKGRIFGGVFLAWLCGTMFMYTFATFLAFIRTMCRKGALYFIRDPSDPTYSPVKDIIDRPAGSQARKLWSSCILYTAVVFWLFGLTCWGFRLLGALEVLPLRFKGFSPLTSVPVDILFLHVIVPPTIESLRLKHRSKKIVAFWWFRTAKICRISPLLLPTRSSNGYLQPDHGADPTFLAPLWSIIDPCFQLLFGKYEPTAGYMRVPATDRVALLPTSQRRREGVFIPLNDVGEPINDKVKIALIRQDLRSKQEGKVAKDDYTIVWLPQFWRTRIHVFIGLAMTCSATVIGAGTLGPVLIGRAVWEMLLDRKVHDGYSFMAGCSVIIGAFRLARGVGRFITSMGRAPRISRSTPVTKAKKLAIAILTDAYSMAMLFGILPLLVGILWDLYVTIPGKYGYQGAGKPVIHAWDAWSMGLLLLCLGTAMTRLTGLRYGVNTWNGLRRCFQQPLGRRFGALNKTILPVVAVLAAQIVVPPVATWLFCVAAGIWQSERWTSAMFRSMYVNCLVSGTVFGGRRWIAKQWRVIKQAMVDREYVLEERVENYEPVEEVKEEVVDTKKEAEEFLEEGEDIVDNGIGEWQFDSDGEGATRDTKREAAEFLNEGEDVADVETGEWQSDSDGEDKGERAMAASVTPSNGDEETAGGSSQGEGAL